MSAQMDLLAEAARRLTPREREVLWYLVGSPATSAEISRALGISPATLREYASRVYQKVGVTGRVELLFICGLRMPLARVVEVLAGE